MTDTEDRVSMAERYSRALDSSHLEMDMERIGDVDVLTASGWTGDHLGSMLLRLRKDYLDVLPGLDLAQAARVQWEKEAARVNAQALAVMQTAPDAYVRLIQEAARLRAEAAHSMLTAHLMALMALPSLEPVKRELAGFASWLATKRRFMHADQIVMAIAGRALDAWLDPLCHSCTGRKFNGGAGSPVMLCRPCGGTGNRYPRLGKTDEDHEFGRALLVEMDRKAEDVSRAMARFLRG